MMWDFFEYFIHISYSHLQIQNIYGILDSLLVNYFMKYYKNRLKTSSLHGIFEKNQ